MRIPIIAGNWKMHSSVEEAVKFVKDLKDEVEKTDVKVVICCPYTILGEIKKEVEGSNIKLGAQNMHWEDRGAYTGEISAEMLKEHNVEYVIIGHSERRQFFNESDESVNKKLLKALEYELTPILCVGETLEEREADKTFEIIRTQIVKALKQISPDGMKNIVIAYEPIWAIGTGKTASPEDANTVIAYIREIIKEKYDEYISELVPIQYGGSVNPSNATAIMNQEDIDGALVGGASLNAESFLEIINF